LRAGRADRIHKKVRSPGTGNAELKIIRREGRRPFGGIRYVAGAAQGEGRKSAAGLRAVESGGFGFAEGAELAGTLFDDVRRTVIWKRGCLSTGPGRIGKNVEICEGSPLDELESSGMFLFGFAREAGDNVGADCSVGEVLTDEFDAASVVFGAIPAVHGGENSVGARLQGHVKVFGQAGCRGEEKNQIASNIERFDGTEAEPFDRGFVENLSK